MLMPTKEKFIYRRRENGIHEMNWYGSDEQVLEAWSAKLGDLYMDAMTDETLCFLYRLVNIGVPSMMSIVSHSRKIQADHPMKPNTRSAVLHESHLVASVVYNLATWLNHSDRDTTRFFLMRNEDKAIRWLSDGLKT
jgi:hypothetical protein